MLFHLPSELVPAYYVEVADYAYVVSAADGAILYRHSLVASDSYGYRVWADASLQHVPWDGPQGSSFSPHPTGIPDFTGPLAFAPSSLLALANGPLSTGSGSLRQRPSCRTRSTSSCARAGGSSCRSAAIARRDSR